MAADTPKPLPLVLLAQEALVVQDIAEDTEALTPVEVEVASVEAVEEVAAVALDLVATAVAMARPVVHHRALEATGVTGVTEATVAMVVTEDSLVVDTIRVVADAHMMTDRVAETVATAEIVMAADALEATWSPLADVKTVAAAAVIGTETSTDLATTTTESAAMKEAVTKILASCVATNLVLAEKLVGRRYQWPLYPQIAPSKYTDFTGSFFGISKQELREQRENQRERESPMKGSFFFVLSSLTSNPQSIRLSHIIAHSTPPGSKGG